MNITTAQPGGPSGVYGGSGSGGGHPPEAKGYGNGGASPSGRGSRTRAAGGSSVAVMAMLAGVVFLFGITGALSPFIGANSEKFFWLPAYGLVGLLILLQPNAFLNAAASNKVFLAWPLIACISALWSDAPSVSAYHGFQLAMTILIALSFAMFVPRLLFLQMLWVALFAASLACMAFIVLEPGRAYSNFGEAKGIFPHKNVLGSLMGLQILTAFCLFLHGWRRVLMFAAMGLSVSLLILSKAGTPLICLAGALTLLPFAILYRSGRHALGLGIGAIALLAAAALSLVVVSGVDPAEVLLGSIGKDQTLTGRTILWQFGWQAFVENPILGLGFKGYWEGNLSTAFYLRYVTGQDLWFFHNNFLETAVAFGVIGPVLLAAGIALALFRTTRAYLADCSFIALWGVFLVVMLLIFAQAENPFFVNHGIFQFLLIVAATMKRSAPYRLPTIGWRRLQFQQASDPLMPEYPSSRGMRR